MKNSFFLILTVIAISLLSCKKEAAIKPVLQPITQPPAVKTEIAVKTTLYDYEKAVRVKRTLSAN